MGELAWRDAPTGPGWYYVMDGTGIRTIGPFALMFVWDKPNVGLQWEEHYKQFFGPLPLPDALQKVDAALVYPKTMAADEPWEAVPKSWLDGLKDALAVLRGEVTT